MELFIGIDQSINSTGLTTELYNQTELIDKHFYIITGNKKMTKKESNAQSVYSEFDYVQYDKIEIKEAKNSHEGELFKTHNLINISHTIIAIISSIINKYHNIDTYTICMEGISYQSNNTSSLLDLAGLNYIIRYDLIRFFKDKQFDLIVAPPGEIKKFASGNGSAKKDIMISLFEASHPNLYLIPKIDDIADSYWMCEYAKYSARNASKPSRIASNISDE